MNSKNMYGATTIAPDLRTRHCFRCWEAELCTRQTRSLAFWSLQSTRRVESTRQSLIIWVHMTSLVAQMVKNLPAIWEIQVLSLGWDDPLEKEWQPTPVFLPGEFHGQRSLAGYSPWGCRAGHDWATNTHTHIYIYLLITYVRHSQREVWGCCERYEHVLDPGLRASSWATLRMGDIMNSAMSPHVSFLLPTIEPGRVNHLY